MTTKHAQILALRSSGLDNAGIAKRVGCSAAYVRVVWQRTDFPGRYNEQQNEYERYRYRNDAEYANRKRAYHSEWCRKKREKEKGQST